MADPNRAPSRQATFPPLTTVRRPSGETDQPTVRMLPIDALGNGAGPGNVSLPHRVGRPRVRLPLPRSDGNVIAVHPAGRACLRTEHLRCGGSASAPQRLAKTLDADADADRFGGDVSTGLVVGLVGSGGVSRVPCRRLGTPPAACRLPQGRPGAAVAPVGSALLRAAGRTAQQWARRVRPARNRRAPRGGAPRRRTAPGTVAGPPDGPYCMRGSPHRRTARAGAEPRRAR